MVPFDKLMAPQSWVLGGESGDTGEWKSRNQGVGGPGRGGEGSGGGIHLHITDHVRYLGYLGYLGRSMNLFAQIVIRRLRADCSIMRYRVHGNSYKLPNIILCFELQTVKCQPPLRAFARDAPIGKQHN